MADRRLMAVSCIATLVAGCASEQPATLETFGDSASYAIGMNMGASVQQVRDQVDLDMLMQGLTAMADGGETVLTEQQAMRILQVFAQQVQADNQAGMAAQSGENRQAGDGYRAAYGAQDGVTTTESGLMYEVLTQASGRKPTTSDRVRVHYQGSLVDGSVFESSYERGEPVVFGVTQVIPGWTEGLQLMSVGSKYRFVIPPELAYGEGGGPGGPGSTLIFEVELLEIVE